MAITTKMTEVQNGITYGYSDTCSTLFANGDWKASELARFSWCRWEDRYMDCIGVTTLDVTQRQGAAAVGLLSYFQNNGGDLKTKYVDDRISGKPYAFNILMYGRNGDLCLNSSNAANYKVVTSCSDFQKLYVKVDTYNQGSNFNVQHPTARTVKRNSLTWVAEGVYNTDNNSYTQWITVWTVLVFDEDTFFVTRGMAFPNRTPGLDDGSLGFAQNNIRPSNLLDLDNTPANDAWYYSYGDIKTYDGSKHLIRWCKNGISSISDTTWTAADQFGCWDIDNDISVFVYGSWGTYRYTYYLRTEEAIKNAIAYTGLRWRYANGDTEHIYTPIIDSDGYITGYSTDPDAETKLNDIIDVTGNNISPLPPAPPTPSGDDIDAQHFGGGTGLGGAENLWLLTTAQMQSLHAAISSCNEPNFEPLNSIISVMGLAIPPIYPLGTDISTLITITFKKADGTRWSSHVEGHICDKQTASFGFTNNIKIKRRYNNFLDYPPYANHEIFLPLCGWLPLPAYAVGRSLQVYYVHDINTCSVRALVLCEGSVIGEKYGTMGANIAFSSNGHALYLGGLISGGVQTLADFTTAMISEGPMALMSAMKGIADGANTLISANQNRTSVIGQNQDRTSFADGQYIRIKSTYPDVKIEENFGHTYGFVCNKKGLLKDFKGFTTCENPHVTGFSCTSSEKEEIEQLLKSGIIIHMSEG